MTLEPLPRDFAGGRLRRLRRADLADFQAYRASPELGRYQGWSPMADPQALAFIDEMGAMTAFAPGEWMQIGIAAADTDRLVGDIGIFIAADSALAEIGFTLETAAQGRGVATSAVDAALRLVFEMTPVRQVRAITDTRNLPSLRLIERLGFRHEATHRTVFRGEPCDEATYVLARGPSR